MKQTFKQFVKENYFPNSNIIKCNPNEITIKDNNGIILWVSYDSLEDIEKSYKNGFVKDKTPKKGFLNELKNILGGADYYIDKRSTGYRIKLRYCGTEHLRSIKALCKKYPDTSVKVENLWYRSIVKKDIIIITTNKKPSLI